ncbi:hypothetical protein SAMN04487996_10291 [Dyadobacter soli]|uniref:Uncharacterized protein n=1 Tax=Dyadobacter soli TaxID=659014 RepID=A0A1G6X887_9BACT|nr:hypothetical protein [Dyadobacter soli]SDD74410.1 hypothetical protein SAMN04487996_10291 [Dyadobacter soli]
MMLKILFPLLFIAGLWFLIRSIGRIIEIYGGKKVTLPLDRPLPEFHLSEPGEYEIAYRRPAILGIMPTKVLYTLVSVPDGKHFTVTNVVNIFGSRKDMTSSRVVPVAEFSIDAAGAYQLSVAQLPEIKNGDGLVIMKKTGGKGFVMIFAILISAIATIGGLVMSILAFLNKL